MFYYISFLRPPPTHAVLHQPILITPQISNDLRTEVFPDSKDLFYSWVQVLPGQDAKSSLTLTTKPQKLTTWRVSSAYKAIPVQPPRNVKEGQFWRLVLMSELKSVAQPRPEAMDLRQGAFDLEERETWKTPLSVWSMPVLFTARAAGFGKGGGGKQEHVERLYLLPTGGHESSSGDAELKLVEQTSFDLDKKIWDSGVGLSSWLCHLRQTKTPTQNPTLLELSNRLFAQQSRIVELGAGIGVVSIALATLRYGYMPPGSITTLENVDENSRSATEVASIFATDVPSALPLLEQNVKLNRQYYSSQTASPIPLVLDWEDEELPDEIKTQGGVDVIVMADVCYNTSFFGALTQTLSKLIKLSTSAEHSKPPFVLLGYKERDEAERTFWDLALQVAGIKFEKVGESKGAGGNAVEIWLGRVS